MLEVRLLGGFEVKHDNKIVTISSRPAQSLFAYLILNTGTSHRREKLAGLLWPDSTEENARNYLRNGLWKLRKAIEKESSKIFGGSYILADDISVSFNPETPYTLDVATIEDSKAECASTDGLMEALSFYKGELLPGFYDEWIVLEREHIQAVFEQKIEWLLEKLQEKARWSDSLDWGERWISFGQKPEAAYRFLMTAHAARGDMSKVVAIFERCTKSLDEIGVTPSEQTLILYENLKFGKDTFEKEKSTIYPVKSKKTTFASPTNLPVLLTSFIGREKEINEVLNLLEEKRLLTLTGPGGVGKTRLAIEVANNVVSKNKDGVWWVELVNLTDQSLVPQSVAKVLDIHEIPDQNLTQTLIEYFQTRQALIVLNNCEHLVSACAQLADQLLSACAELKILTTGREALDILGETIWLVPSLTLPNTQNTQESKTFNEFESIRLFVDRAQSVKPTFELTEQNGGSIVQICQRLSGMPLAIELAAARIKIMSTEEIALRLNDCFDLLTSGSRTALPHHQTLRATIDWSYDLLSKAEKTFFRRLSVFVGGFTLDAAEATAAGGDVAKNQVVDLLEQLVNKSLVTVDASSEEGEADTRFGMLETIREYLYEKLEISGEIEKVKEQHLVYFIAYAEEAERNNHSDKSVLWQRKLGKDIDNIRTAVDWCIESGKAIEAMRLVGALISSLFQFDSPSEWQKRLDAVLELPSGQEKTPERAKALYGIGELYWSNINPVDKTPELQEALDIGKRLRDKHIVAKALSNLGLFASLQDDLVQARSYLEQSLAVFNEQVPVNKRDSIEALTYLGEVVFNQNQLDEARTLYQEIVNILRETGDKISLALAIRRLGQLALHEGNHETAIALCTESLNMNCEIEDRRGILASISAFAAIAQVRGQMQAAAQLFGAVQATLGAMNLRFLKMDRLEYERNLDLFDAMPGQASLKKSWANGAAMTPEQAIEFALNLVS